VRKLMATAATAVLATGGLTACTDEAQYCADLAGYVAKATGVNPSNPEDYAQLLDQSKKLEEKAPDEVKDDWKVLVSYAERAKAAGGDAAKLAELSAQTPQVTTATKAIAAHAKEACKVDVPSVGS
jgi:hypothetical protein